MRARRIAVGAWVAILGLGLASGCGGAAASSTSSAVRSIGSTVTSASASATTAPAARHRPRPRRRQPARPAPGTLPQTAVRPSAHTREFRAEMAALWRGIRADSVRAAAPAFFPEAAYARLKAIGNPQADWRWRLVGDYALDIGAAHRLVGPHARLVGVAVPAGYAHWVPPGVCDNTDGYWEVPNARVVYRDDAGIQSFGIASLISWRGVWYVVHLGAVLRSTGSGVVDAPSPGAGTAVYSSTC